MTAERFEATPVAARSTTSTSSSSADTSSTFAIATNVSISWWLYDAAPDYEVWTDDEKTKWCLKEPEALYDFIRDECQG